MALHKDLTGAELHEPKGVADQPAGRVYVSDGEGSGTWQDKNADNLLLNRQVLNERMSDISTPNSRVFFYVPSKSQLDSVAVILEGPITTANATISLYVDNVLLPFNLSVPFSSSTAGTKTVLTVNTSNTINAGSVLEVRTDGNSETASAAFVTVVLRAKA